MSLKYQSFNFKSQHNIKTCLKLESKLATSQELETKLANMVGKWQKESNLANTSCERQKANFCSDSLQKFLTSSLLQKTNSSDNHIKTSCENSFESEIDSIIFELFDKEYEKSFKKFNANNDVKHF